MPVGYVDSWYDVRRPTRSDWQKFYEAKGCSYNKAADMADRAVRKKKKKAW